MATTFPPPRTRARASSATSRRIDVPRARRALGRPSSRSRAALPEAASELFANLSSSSSSSSSSFLTAYDAALASAPVLTKSITSWAGFTIADVVAQALTNALDLDANANDDGRSGSGSVRFDPSRTLRNGLFGLAFYGPVSGAWYACLDANVMTEDPNGATAVAAKTFLDQALWAPALVTSLFAWDLACSGEPLFPGDAAGDAAGDAGKTKTGDETRGNGLPAKLRRDLIDTLYVNWSFWPAFHVLNFSFVPPGERILYVNVVQVIYNVFLCVKAADRGTRDAAEGREGGA